MVGVEGGKGWNPKKKKTKEISKEIKEPLKEGSHDWIQNIRGV